MGLWLNAPASGVCACACSRLWATTYLHLFRFERHTEPTAATQLVSPKLFSLQLYPQLQTSWALNTIICFFLESSFKSLFVPLDYWLTFANLLLSVKSHRDNSKAIPHLNLKRFSLQPSPTVNVSRTLT